MDAARGERCDVADRVARFVQELSSEDGRTAWPAVPDAALQDLMALAVRMYAARASAREDRTSPVLPAFRPDAGVSATQVAIAAEQLLAAAEVDIFELQMWRMLGTY